MCRDVLLPGRGSAAGLVVQAAGGWATDKAAVWVEAPPGPVQARVKERPFGPCRIRFCDPLICCGPLQSPLATQDSALNVDQVMVALCPGWTELG